MTWTLYTFTETPSTHNNAANLFDALSEFSQSPVCPQLGVSFYPYAILDRAQHGCAHIPTITVAKLLSNFAPTNDTHISHVHYGDIIIGTMASQITSLTIVYSTVYTGADQRKHQSSASLAFVRGIHRGRGNSPHRWRVTRKMFPFDDVIMEGELCRLSWVIQRKMTAIYRGRTV